MELALFAPAPIGKAREEDIFNHLKTENVVSRNDYAGIAAKWKRSFDDDHFFMFFFEDIAREPNALMQRICGFLGVAAFPDALAGELREKVAAGSYEDFPLKYKKLIAELTIGHIRSSAETFGGHCLAWLEEAEALLG